MILALYVDGFKELISNPLKAGQSFENHLNKYNEQ